MQKELNTADTMSYLDATGPIAVTLRNDMMFHCVMQRSNNALKGLVCALKGLDPSLVKEVTLMNPIDYSEYAQKEIILDVKVLLNSNEILDIELQLYYDKDWEKRSLLYLCRSFDSLPSGEEYRNIKPTTLIAIMDNPLFPEHPEFYSHYQLLNVSTHEPYSSLISLNVLYLNRTDLASQSDYDNGLVYWAKLFKATTWEDLKSLVNVKNEFKEVVRIMYSSNLIQSQEKTLFEAHQRYLTEQASLRRQMEDIRDELEAVRTEAEKARAEGYERGKAEAQEELARLRRLLEEAGISE